MIGSTVPGTRPFALDIVVQVDLSPEHVVLVVSQNMRCVSADTRVAQTCHKKIFL